MKIVTANAAGICFGVRDALEILEGIDTPREVAILGELVHNDVVLHQLDTRGFQSLAETQRDQLPAAPQVVITAHGISDRRRRQLIDAGRTLIDTTCPLVIRVHRAAQELARSGAFVVVIGRRDHVEVDGIIGDLDSFAVVKSADEVGLYHSAKIGIVCQTTFPCQEADVIRERIHDCNPTAEIIWVDTICQPTKDRQQALRELLTQVQAVVVVGGRRSHNTHRLVETCRHAGLATWLVESADELDPHWFSNFDTVGLTAGTSTLPQTLDQVHERLLAIAADTNRVA